MARPRISDQLIVDPIESFPLATVACFDPLHGDLPRRELDEPRTVAFLEKLARLNVPAVLIGSSTGHGHLRTCAELEQWFSVAGQADLRHTLRFALLRPEDGIEVNRKLIGLLCDRLYHAVFFRPGTDLPASASDDAVAANIAPHLAVAAEAGLAVGLYSIPDVSGVRLSAPAAARLVQSPGGDRLVAIKVTEPDYDASTRQFLEHPELKSLKIVQGWDPHLCRALADGPTWDAGARQRCGITSGPMSLALFQYLHILDCTEKGNWAEAELAQQAVTSVFESMQDDPRRFADLQRAKYVMGLGHPLDRSIEESQTKRLLAAVEALDRDDDRRRLAQSLDLMGDGPFCTQLAAWAT